MEAMVVNLISDKSDLSLPQFLNDEILANNYKFVITGASGWLGKSLLEILYFCFKEKMPQSVMAVSNSQSEITLRSGYKIPTYAYDHEFKNGQKYILCHLAFLTMDKLTKIDHDEYVKQNQIIQKNVIKIINNINPISIFYSSSGAVYNKNNLYGILKLEDEAHFQALSKKLGCKIIIPRIFNLAGPYINKYNLYALSDFIMQLVEDKKILINANHPVIRSYIHVLDLFKICFSWILDENKDQECLIFDTGGQKEIELFELAKMVVELINPNGRVIRKNYNADLPANYYVGDLTLQRQLCQKYDIMLANYQSMILDTFCYLNRLQFKDIV